MASKRETVLQALDGVLRVALTPLGAQYDRNLVLPTRTADKGNVILRDGDPGEPESTLSPQAWHYEHRAEIEVFVQKGSGREAALDNLLLAIGIALAGDRTLGGAVEWAEPEAPQPSDLPIEAGLEMRAVILTVVLHYSTTDPLQ